MESFEGVKRSGITLYSFLVAILLISAQTQAQSPSGDKELLDILSSMGMSTDGGSRFFRDSMVPFYIRDLMQSFDSMKSLGDVIFKDLNNLECEGHITAWLERFKNITTAELWALHSKS